MPIILQQLTKRYAGHPVVNHVSVEIGDGECFVLIGPSGSGKSTILRLIAGLNAVDEGRVLVNGRDLTHAPPQQRDVGFVFQHYALFKYMTVAENIEFALRVRRVAAPERRRRRDELLEMVGLAGLGGRLPNQLSGGQQQRVALARALAHRPQLLLLDEPFGALDAKIRVDLRRTLRRIQQELGLTVLFVTHDQDEAFELADRLGVMNFGRLLEVGRPADLYQRPQTEFVATFLGTANLLVGQATAGGIQVGPVHFPLAGATPEAGRVQVLFRPEEVTLAETVEQLDGVRLGQGHVEQSAFAGAFERLRLRLPALPGVRPIAPTVAFGTNAILIEASRPDEQSRHWPLTPGSAVWVGVRRIHALAHPGLHFLLLTDGSALAHEALNVGGQMARLAHARVTVLGYGQRAEVLERHLQTAKESLGSGLAALETRLSVEPLVAAVTAEVERRPYDLVIAGFAPQGGLTAIEQILQAGEHHLLLIPSAPLNTLARALICVAGGEQGKDDVLFAGRLMRHLGTEASVFSVLPETEADPLARERMERYLEGGVLSLQALGVPAVAALARGEVRAQIRQQLTRHDWLVLGAPLTERTGQVTLGGVVGQVLTDLQHHPTLIVQSHQSATAIAPRRAEGRLKQLGELHP